MATHYRAGADAEVHYDVERQTVLIAVRNVGSGAAYYVDAGLDLGPSVVPAAPWSRSGEEPRNFAVVPAGEETYLHFTHIDEPPRTCEVIIDYGDLSGSRYSSRIEIGYLPTWYPDRRREAALLMQRVERSVGRELIPWNKPPSLWWRLKRAVRDWWREKQRQRAEGPAKADEDEPDPF